MFRKRYFVINYSIDFDMVKLHFAKEYFQNTKLWLTIMIHINFFY